MTGQAATRADQGMTETDVAHAIAAGKLRSPQQFGAFWLWSMRVSGSGWAERPALNELVYRPPETFVTPEMAARCAGLPVCIGHPESGTLDSFEFAARTVGTVVMGYINGSEIWCICRVYDSDINQALASGAMSTSPSVIFRATDGNQQIDLPGGGHVLIEGTPALMDHLAIVPSGTWDKGGPPTGIRADQSKGVANMDDNAMMNDAAPGEAGKADPPAAAQPDPMSKLMQMLGGLCNRLDAMDKTLADYKKRMDAFGSAGPEYDQAAPPGSPALTAADAARRPKKSLAQERADNALLAEAQRRADRCAVEFGQRAEPPMVGESPTAYRLRLLRPFRKYSEDYKSIDVDAINDPALLDIVEQRIYADATEAARRCEHVEGDGPHPVHRTDESGRKITTWRGRRTFIAAMKPQSMRAKFRQNFA